MASSWSGKVYVVMGNDGKYHIGITLPPGALASGQVQIFDATGPRPPTGFPEMLTVDDPDAWLAQHRQAGFCFKPTTN